MRRVRPAFLPLWTIAVTATASAFVVHLALRGRTVQLGYDLGRARQERVEIVARTLLGMEPPPPERILSIPQTPGAEPPSPPVLGYNGAGEGPP
jgi:cell division protein FtsL